MSKKYFAKYIILDGEEVKKGDKCYVADYDSIETFDGIIKLGDVEVYSFVDVDRENFLRVETTGALDKVELSLCSRDIQVYDNCWINDDLGLRKAGKYSHSFPEEPNSKFIKCSFDSGEECYDDEVFKVIGKISRHASWVKEGDEFDDSEIDQKVETKMMDERWWTTEGDVDVEDVFMDRPLKEITLEELLEDELKTNPYLESYKILARYKWKDADDEAEVRFYYKEYFIKGPCGHFH